MVETAFLPWWLPLIGTPLLLTLMFLGLARLDLTKFV